MVRIKNGAFRAVMTALVLVASLPALAAPPTWIVDDGESRIGVTATQTGAPFEAAFETFTADIAFDPGDLGASRVSVLIDIASFNSSNSDRDTLAMGADWFDTSAFPQARFEASAFRHLGGDAYEADGTLGIRDVTREVTLPFTLDIDGDTARMHAELMVDRTNYDLGRGDFASAELVGYGVTIIIDLTARRAS